MISKTNFLKALDIIGQMYPDAKGELNADTPFQLLIAVILSAQATDKGVNKATPALFEAYPDADSLAQASLEDVEDKIRTIGLYKTKAKNIIRTAQMLIADYDGQIPLSKEELVKLPGVGRKTANVVLGDAFGIPGIAVDTHVSRVAKRLQVVKQSADVDEIEDKLMAWVPENDWVKTHHRLILFGRYHCTAKKPQCDGCPVLPYCKFGVKELNGK
jgi:endonuclease-3